MPSHLDKQIIPDSLQGTTAEQLTVPQQDHVLCLAREILQSRYQVGALIQSPTECAEYLLHELGKEEREIFGVLFLTQQHSVIEFKRLFYGTIAEAAIYPREIVKYALTVNAAATILTHNHPSGSAVPSQADIEITARIQKALQLVSINVLDHIIVTHTQWTSFKEEALL